MHVFLFLLSHLFHLFTLCHLGLTILVAVLLFPKVISSTSLSLPLLVITFHTIYQLFLFHRSLTLSFLVLVSMVVLLMLAL